MVCPPNLIRVLYIPLHHYDVIVTNYRTCEAVVAGVVAKCLNARARTKQGGIDVCLMYTEIEQQGVVQVTIF